MRFRETAFDGVYLVELEERKDERGFFARLHCEKEFEEKVRVKFKPVQCSLSYNRKKGTLRGLHFQIKPFEERKLVVCVSGAIFDVVVDIRKGSPNFGKWQAFLLSPHENERRKWCEILQRKYEKVNNVFFPPSRTELFIPRGFAHGFITLEDNTEILYMIDEFFSPQHSAGIRWDSPEIGIIWPLEPKIISERDRTLPALSEIIEKL